jgi:hypothetical protein
MNTLVQNLISFFDNYPTSLFTPKLSLLENSMVSEAACILTFIYITMLNWRQDFESFIHMKSVREPPLTCTSLLSFGFETDK